MILDIYLARRSLATFMAVFGIFLALTLLIGMVEHIRKFDVGTVGFLEVINLTLLSAPWEIVRILPLIMAMATLALFLSLAHSCELVILRSTGRAIFRTLLAPLVVAFLIGIFTVAILNPIVASTSNQYDIVAGRNVSGGSSVLSVSPEGLWLRQAGSDGQTVIRAVQSNLDGTEFFGVTFFGFGPDGVVDYRVEADSAKLVPEAWQLNSAKEWRFDTVENPERESINHAELNIPTSLTVNQIRDSFGAPSSIPIWELSGFIKELERAGLSPLRHQVWMHMELALPLMLVAMALIGAGLSMRHTKFRKTSKVVLLTMGLAFGSYVIRNFAQILGENGQIPVLLAAWSPPAAAIMLMIGIVLNLEDG